MGGLSRPQPTQQNTTSNQPGGNGGNAGNAGNAGGNNPLAALASNPMFTQLRQAVQANPQLLPVILNQIAQSNPQLYQVVRKIVD